MSDGSDQPVYIVEYEPAWAAVFRQLATIIGTKLGTLALRIEHIGSTSVPGLAAKPIIDLDVVVESWEDLPEVIARLGELGYCHEGERGVPGREVFGRSKKTVPEDGRGTRWMNHHLYVCSQDSEELARHLAFRDYLRAHPEAREEYAALKRSLAATHGYDREAYTDGKHQFVVGILQKLQSLPRRRH